MRLTTLLILSALLAGCGRNDSSSASSPGGSSSSQPWKSISGGQECRFAGVVAEVPGGWTVQQRGDATMIDPPGANPSSIDEVYAFLGAPALKDLNTPALEAYLDNSLMQMLQVPVRRSGEAKSVKIGALDGRAWSWSATLLDGRAVDIRCWAFTGSYVGSLVAVATPEALKRRQPDLEAILGSFRRPAAAAIDAARLCTTWVRAFGSGTAMVGNSNEQRITFDAGGRYHYHSEGTSHGVFHNGSSQTDISGSWKLSGDQLTCTTDSGESKTFTVEARNEAGTGAAVIAVDGTEFRQADGRGW
ncbi:MAG: lipocalin family protein [Planctomycetota bacterium]